MASCLFALTFPWRFFPFHNFSVFIPRIISNNPSVWRLHISCLTEVYFIQNINSSKFFNIHIEMTQHKIEHFRHTRQNKEALRYITLILLSLLVKFQESNQQFRNRFVVITSGLETMVRIMVKPSWWYLTVHHHLSYSHHPLLLYGSQCHVNASLIQGLNKLSVFHV